MESPLPTSPWLPIILCDADVSKLQTTIIWTPVIKCGINWHQKDLCSKEIELRAQKMLLILGSTINMIGGTYMTT